MLFNPSDSNLFGNDIESEQTKSSSSSPTKKTKTKSPSELTEDSPKVDQNNGKTKKSRKSAKDSKAEEPVTLKTNLDFDMLNNMPMASAKSFVSSNKVVDDNGMISYQDLPTKKNKVLESIKKSKPADDQNSTNDSLEDFTPKPLLRKPRKAKIDSNKVTDKESKESKELGTESEIKNLTSSEEIINKTDDNLSQDNNLNESNKPNTFNDENGLDETNNSILSNHTLGQEEFESLDKSTTPVDNSDNADNSDINVKNNLEDSIEQSLVENTNNTEVDISNLDTPTPTPTPNFNSNSADNDPNYNPQNNHNLQANITNPNQQSIISSSQDYDNHSGQEQYGLNTMGTAEVDEYANSLYNLDPTTSSYDSFNEDSNNHDPYNRPKVETDDSHILTNGYIRDIAPIPSYQAPFIDYSTGDEFNRRKENLLVNMDNYGRLSNFEVDLYTTYPNLLPNTTLDFRKNTVQYCKALHELKFEFLFFDTETTGMNTENSGSKAEGHRIITIGMVPYFNGKLYEEYKYCVDMSFDPEQAIDLEASKVHGIYNSDLVNSGSFADFIPQLKEIVTGKVLCAHNASFDVDFINHELDLANAGWHLEDVCLVIDSLAIARTISNGRASLDALSKRYNINIERTFHGALLDSIILGHVYLAMLNSYQDSMFGKNNSDEFDNPLNILEMPNFDHSTEYANADKLCISLTDEELELHNKFISNFSEQDKFIELEVADNEQDELDELDEEEFEENL